MDIKLSQWYDQTIAFLPNLLLIAVILLVTRIISRQAQRLVGRLTARTQAPAAIGDLLGSMARFVVAAFGILLVLGQLGLSSAVLSFVTGLGITGIIIGFALQDIVKQFAAGMLLLMLRPFRIGDDVKIGAFEGRVIAVQLRATVLETNNGDEVLIPNADVYTTAITNMSRYDLHRYDITVSLPPLADPLRVSAALTHELGEIAGIAASPAPAVAATGFDLQAVKLEVRFWVDERASDADAVKTAVIAAIHKAIAEPEGEEKRRQGDGETGSS
jgi:small conductance mechanosensitive channel